MMNNPKTSNPVSNDEEWGDDYSSPLLEELSSAVTAEEQEQTDYKMKMASKIYKAMKAQGMNQTKFAAAMGGKQVSLVSRWLSGTHNFTIDTLIDIQRVLGISLLDVESAQSQPALNVKLRVSSAIPGWTAFDLEQYINNIGGMAATEKALVYTEYSVAV